MSTETINSVSGIRDLRSIIPKQLIENSQNKIVQILGGIDCILDHYTTNANLLNDNQASELHQFLLNLKPQSSSSSSSPPNLAKTSPPIPSNPAYESKEQIREQIKISGSIICERTMKTKSIWINGPTPPFQVCL